MAVHITFKSVTITLFVILTCDHGIQANKTCPLYLWTCSNGECINKHWKCNGVYDCTDRSDELDCSNFSCRTNEFKCPIGHFLHNTLVVFNCGHHSAAQLEGPEMTCHDKGSSSTASGSGDRSQSCVRAELRCQQKRDNVLVNDQKNCSSDVCGFRCDSTHCVSTNNKCDFVYNCANRSEDTYSFGNQTGFKLRGRLFLLAPKWAVKSNLTVKRYGTQTQTGTNGSPGLVTTSHNKIVLICVSLIQMVTYIFATR